jgi:hypothetical protein
MSGSKHEIGDAETAVSIVRMLGLTCHVIADENYAHLFGIEIIRTRNHAILMGNDNRPIGSKYVCRF